MLSKDLLTVCVFSVLCNSINGERERSKQDAAPWTKLLITSGWPRALFNDVAVIDLSAEAQTCRKLPDTFGGSGQVGAFVEGKPMACGGDSFQDDKKCYFYDKQEDSWVPAPPTAYDRTFSAGVQINETAWWVTGGMMSDNVYLIGSEIYTAHVGWSDHVDLPVGNFAHCLVKVDDTRYFMGGGYFQGMRAYLFETSSSTWTPLEDAAANRDAFPTCGVITRSNGEKEVVVAGGVFSDSSEIFSLSTMTWRAGPVLPFEMNLAFGVPFGSTFLVVGGNGGTEYYDTILMYDQVHDGWEVLPQKVPTGRGVYSAFLVPDEAVDCS